MLRTARAATLTAAWLLLPLLLGGCERPEALQELHGATMGTTWHVRAIAPGLPQATLEGEVRQVLDAVDLALSTYRPDSELSRFNARRDSGFVPVSPELDEVLVLSLAIGAETGGAFDPSVAPLLRLWGIGAARPLAHAPEAAEIAAARAHVGLGLLERRAQPTAWRKRDPALELNVDGIAPGYAVDRIAAAFEARGLRRYLIEIGGEVRGRGHNQRGEPWRVAIEAPQPGRPVPHAVLALDGLAVSTSGDYRSQDSVGGRRVSHTLDPRSGRPVEHGLASVVVLDASAARADALATALTVMGPERGLAWAEAHSVPVLYLLPGAGDGYTERASSAFRRLRRL